MNKKIVIFALLTVLILGCVGYYKSTLALDKVTITFTSERKDVLNTLTTHAPYGYYVIEYSLVPSSGSKQTFEIGGKGVPQYPISLFGESRTHSNNFPKKGSKTFAVEKHTQISGKLNYAATAKLPKDKKILSRCGTYIIATKNKDIYKQLDALVRTWTVNNGPWSKN